MTVSADPSGKPIPRITIPARTRNSQAVPPLLAYERRGRLPDGAWEFRYVGTEA